MRVDHPHHGRPLRIGSLFSGYGGLDLAIEHALGAETAWFSEINEPVTRVFASHWPDVPNLGDISTIDWDEVKPVDVLTGGFPCQDVSTVGKQAGLDTRYPLWAVVAHGRSDRRTATPTRGDRERARAALILRDPPTCARSRP